MHYMFDLTDENEIRSVITTYGINCSPVDPIPIQLLKNNVYLFIPIGTDLVNLSLSQGSLDCLKMQYLTLYLLRNYRPVSNLVFLSKFIESSVAIRLEDHMNQHSSKQYGYKKGHSTEMLLVKVANDLLIAYDKKLLHLIPVLHLTL